MVKRKEKVYYQIRSSALQQCVVWFSWLTVAGIAVAALAIAIIATSNNLTIQQQLDNVLLSVIVNTGGGSRSLALKDGHHKKTIGPPSLPLPPGVTAFHTATCFYQDGHPLSIFHLNDVDTSGATTGNVLGFDGTSFTNISKCMWGVFVFNKNYLGSFITAKPYNDNNIINYSSSGYIGPRM